MIIKGLCTAILFSGFLYLSHFGFEFKILPTIFALSAFYFLLTIERTALFFTGFFVGIFWFYWVSFSFVYYDLHYLVPFIVLGMALFYGLVFLLIAAINHVYFRVLAIMLLSFFEPFSFNWLKPELLLVNTYFFPSKLLLLLLLIATLFLIQRRILTYAALILTCFFMSMQTPKSNPSALDIAMPSFDIKQKEKWQRQNLPHIIESNLQLIDQAILDKKELIILPETAFPLILNNNASLIKHLKKRSQDIAILTGSLYKNGEEYNNTTYLFQKGEVQIAHKVVLVPFGEAVPFPELIRNFINDVFYDGAQDYTKAAKPTDFTIKNEVFRNAICYEATTDTIFQDLNGLNKMIVTSNNAWFTPSIEPTLQRLLLRYFSKKYGVTIYHVANGSSNDIITP
jgi:apolipoprotein N-acyltransferase